LLRIRSYLSCRININPIYAEKSIILAASLKNRFSPAGTDQFHLAKDHSTLVGWMAYKDDKEGWRSGCKGGRKKHCLDLQLVVRLIIDIDDCDNQTGNTLPSSL
jgi:hypothetical protein